MDFSNQNTDEHVVLVDALDNELGTMEKQEAHIKGALHRAFSVFIFNNQGELMLQKRADGKYHSGGLWSNTCCSHPRFKEKPIAAAKRRLKEEMGFDCELEYKFSFIYKADLPNGLIEHELDYVFFGEFNKVPKINPDEVSDWKFLSLDSIKEELSLFSENYTAWFRIVFDRINK